MLVGELWTALHSCMNRAGEKVCPFLALDNKTFSIDEDLN